MHNDELYQRVINTYHRAYESALADQSDIDAHREAVHSYQCAIDAPQEGDLTIFHLGVDGWGVEWCGGSAWHDGRWVTVPASARADLSKLDQELQNQGYYRLYRLYCDPATPYYRKREQ